MNRVCWALAALLILVLASGCGEGRPPDEAEQTTTATVATDSLDYVAFGDSLATGYGVDSYVDRYAASLNADTGMQVNVNNLGVNGLTSGQLRAIVENDRQARDAIEQARIITLNIGANDLLQTRLEYKTGYCGGIDNQDCLRQAVTDFRTNWDAILEAITGLRSPDAAIIRTMDFYNPFVTLDGATVSWPGNENDALVFDKYLEQVNSHVARSSDAYGIPYGRVHEAFNGPDGDEDPNAKGYLQPDGIHPNAEGHAIIARELRELGYEPLVY